MLWCIMYTEDETKVRSSKCIFAIEHSSQVNDQYLYEQLLSTEEDHLYTQHQQLYHMKEVGLENPLVSDQRQVLGLLVVSDLFLVLKVMQRYVRHPQELHCQG